MKSTTFVILYVHLVVLYLEAESYSITRDQLNGDPEILYHNCQLQAPPDQTYKFMAFLTKIKYYEEFTECVPHGSAAIVTNIHAIISASLLVDYSPEKIRKLALLVGGFGPCSNHVCKGAHAVLDAKPHPKFSPSQDPLFADIAVVFLETAIDPVKDGASMIPLSLEDVENNLIVTQLGWVEIDPDLNRLQNYWCWDLLRRRFRVALVNKNHLFKSRSIHFADLGDHGGPVFTSSAGQFELVGLASQPSTYEPAIYTKIYNFLPFIAHQLKIDKNAGNRVTPYDPMLWIAPLLNSRFANCALETIIND